MIQSMVLVSVALELLMVNEVPALRVYERWPTVPPVVARESRMRELAVTNVLLTVTVPATSVELPIAALVPSLISSLLPAVVKLRLPVILAAVEMTSNTFVEFAEMAGLLDAGRYIPLVGAAPPLGMNVDALTDPPKVASPVEGKL